MFQSRQFWWGVVAGLVVVYAYHHFVSPLPGTKTSPAMQRSLTG